MEINIQELPEYEVAFIRCTGSYFEPQDHWEIVISGAVQNGLFPPQQSFIGVSLDNPDLVAEQHCRHDACVTIPKNFEREKT